MTKAIEKKQAGGAVRDAQKGTRAGKGVDANPLAIVAGGIAIGLVAGALIPKTRRETELLGGVGKRMTNAAASAADAARDAAKAELGSLPLNRDALRAQAGKVLDQVSKALSSAGEAALKSRDDASGSVTKVAKRSK